MNSIFKLYKLYLTVSGHIKGVSSEERIWRVIVPEKDKARTNNL